MKRFYMAGSLFLPLPLIAETINSDIVQTLASLFFVLIVILFSAWALKALRNTVFKSTHYIKLTHQISLGPKERLALVEVEDQKLLIGITAGSINLIKELDFSDADKLVDPAQSHLNIPNESSK